MRLRILVVAADHAVTLRLEDLVLRFSRKEKVVSTIPISFSFRQGDRIAILSVNRKIRDALLGSFYGLVQPASGRITNRGLMSWPLGLKGGLDGKLTLRQNMQFLGGLYQDRVAPLDLEKFLSTFLDAAKLSPDERLKNLRSKDQKLFYVMAALAFTFDIFLVPSAQFLMGSEKDQVVHYLRSVFEARIENQTLITTSGNKKFLKDFCDRGLAIGPSGQQLFEGTLGECFDWMKASSSQSDDGEDNDTVDESLFSRNLSNEDNQSELLEII